MWNFEKIFHDNMGNSPKLKTPKMKDKVHRKKCQLGFFFPVQMFLDFLHPYPKFPLLSLPLLPINVLPFFSPYLKNMGSNQLLIIVFAGDSYI